DLDDADLRRAGGYGVAARSADPFVAAQVIMIRAQGCNIRLDNDAAATLARFRPAEGGAARTPAGGAASGAACGGPRRITVPSGLGHRRGRVRVIGGHRDPSWHERVRGRWRKLA
ncbi:hypothetical protein, partial [Nocardia cyriacigeorgica]|uniref:hypothetical protein n=1 Tax=Nocardia cyriacigeorgica TaxID=135487 RepID=UPI002455C9F6